MQHEFVSITQFCGSHSIAESFVLELQEYELVTLKIVDDHQLLHIEELPKLEKMVRLHLELNINIEGIGAVYHLLERTEQLQEEIQRLKNKLIRQQLEI